MEFIKQIRRSPLFTRIFYIFTPSLIITTISFLLMPRIVDSIYSNFIIADPTTFEIAPVGFHDYWVPLGNIFVFIFCLIIFFVWLWSPIVEEFL